MAELKDCPDPEMFARVTATDYVPKGITNAMKSRIGIAIVDAGESLACSICTCGAKDPSRGLS